MPPRVCLAMSLIAWWIVSGWLAQSCSSRSPPSQAGSSESFGKAVIGVSLQRLAAGEPVPVVEQASSPTDSVTVRPSAGTTGPSTSLSDGGWLTPRSGGVPPVVRNRARVVSVCIRSASSALLDAVASNDATQVNACLPDGPGVSTPDWCTPWNGYDASVTGPAVVAALASAWAPPISTPPVSAVPAAPAAVPLRKLRRLMFTKSLLRFRRSGAGGEISAWAGPQAGRERPRASQAARRWPRPRAGAGRARPR